MREIIDEIELCRQRLLSDDRLVFITDYGAGAPSDKRTQEEMYCGKSVEVYVRDMVKIGLKGDALLSVLNILSSGQPKIVLELGTCCGFSSAAFAKILPNSSIYTIEGSKELADIAAQNHVALNCQNIAISVGRFVDVLPELLKRLEKIDAVFIDGHHDKQATIDYFNAIAPYMTKNGAMIFDDISWSNGMKEAWLEISQSERFSSTQDFGKIGVGFIK